MEQLGFELSHMLKDASTQKNRLRNDLEVMNRVINQYNKLLDKMDRADVCEKRNYRNSLNRQAINNNLIVSTLLLLSQIQLFKTTVMEVEKSIQPGLTRFNWNSLNISDYAQHCEKLLKNLNSLMDQVNHVKLDLDNRITTELQTYNLFLLPSHLCNSDELIPCKVRVEFIFFSQIPTLRLKRNR